MASFPPSSMMKQHITACFLFVVVSSIHSPVNGCFTSIFTFGDSLSDTGNLHHISISSHGKLPGSVFFPNGRTFFHHPAGRYCDGRLIIDFIAEAFGLPFSPPYLGGKKGGAQNFQHGVNLAVAGATALDSVFLAESGIYGPTINISLEDELGFFKDVMLSLCPPSSDCKELLQSSLIVLGEIGENDYSHAFLVGKNIEEIRQFVPLVVQTIASTINELIELGAVTFLVPGSRPIGCSAAVLTDFQGSEKEKYDPLTGCLTGANGFSEYHNELLQQELEKIRKLHPDVNIIYADYYNTAMRIYRSPEQFGFRETLKACCGMGGSYYYNSSQSCGYPPLTSSCNDPSSFVSWDGSHYTEATNRFLSKAILEGSNTNPGLNSLCPSLTVNNKLSQQQ